MSLDKRHPKNFRKAWSGGKKPPTPAVVTAQCMGCGAKRDIRAGEIPVGDHPCCEACGMPMIAISARRGEATP